MEVDRDRAVLAAFVGVSVLGGGNAVGIRFSNRELDPLWGASVRFALAGLLLLAAVAVLRLRLPRGRALAGAAVFGALNFGLGFALAYYALVRLHAGFGQIVLAIVPLLTLLLAVAWRQERFRAASALGALLALVGVAVMSRGPLRETVPAVSLVAALGSALCVAQATVLVRRFPPMHPVVINAVGMTVGAAILLAGALVAGESLALPERRETWTAIAYLVVVGSGVVFVLYLFLIGRWGASRAAYTFVLIPVSTVALSAWLDAEPVGLPLVFGGIVVVVGVYLGALRPAD